MVVTGTKRWLALFCTAFIAGIMVYVPYLRYSYYDQMVTLFSVSTNIADAAHVNEFIGNTSLIEAVVCMIGYPIGGFLTDKWSEKWMLIAGGALMGACTIWFGFLTGTTSIYAIFFLYGIGVVLIFSPYLVVSRKLGTSAEQGKMFSTAETVRGVIGAVLGFLAVGILNGAVLNGVTDPVILASKWKLALIIDGLLFFAGCIGLFFLLPTNLIGAETLDATEEAPAPAASGGIGGIIRALKLPGTWFMTLLIFFAYSFVSCGSGYLGTYSVQILGISTTTASTLAVIRNYILGIFSVLLIGVVADKIGLRSKTLGIYIGLATIITGLMLLVGGASPVLAIAISCVFAFIFMGMKGIYFATMGELGIPLELSGIVTGIVSLLAYLPDVYFSKLAGKWLDNYGEAGFNYIWFWAIGCGVLGVITAFFATRYANKIAGTASNN